MASIVDVIDISQNLPSRPEFLVRRENVLDTIQRYFDAGIEVIGVEGGDGFGKTTLLGEFTRKHSSITFSVFLRATSQIGYDPRNVRYDLANQVQWYLRSTRLLEDEEIDDGLIRQRFSQLQRKAKRLNAIFYIVIDGLDELPSGAEHIKENILDILPIGLKEFRFVFSGDVQKILGERYSKLYCKSLPLSPFSHQEVMEYLQDTIPDKHSREEINKSCRGIPGYLASVLRMIRSGVEIENLLEELPYELSQLFDIEWKATDGISEKERLMLAVLAFTGRRRYLSELTKIAQATEEDAERITSLPFISKDGAGTVQYVSESFCVFAMSKLEHFRRNAVDLHVRFLQTNPLSTESLTRLPGLLEEVGQYDALIESITAKHLIKAIEHHSSINVALSQLQLALKIAFKQAHYESIAKFSIFNSVLAEMSASEILRSELDARVAIGQDDAAMALANSAPLIEDRVQLLAHVCRVLRERDKDPGLQSQIENLALQLSPESLGAERAVDIASDLFPVSPESAIAIIESATKSEGANAVDSALIHLTVEALRKGFNSETSAKDLNYIKQKISKDKIKDAFSNVEIFLSPKSADEIRAEAERLSRPGDALFLLRNWLVIHAADPKSPDVIQYALELAIKSTAYAPNASFYRDIASPLPNLEENSVLAKIIGLLDGQQELIRKQGPIAEYVRMELLIAEAEIKWSMNRGCDRLVNVYLDVVVPIEDLMIKGVCLAWFAATLYKIDENGRIESQEGIMGMVEKDLDSCIDGLLRTTAEHFEATRQIIGALATQCPDYALHVANSLNNCVRRDEAVRIVVDGMLEHGNVELVNVEAALSHIRNQGMKGGLILDVIRLHAKTDRLRGSKGHFYKLATSVYDVSTRCKAIAVFSSTLGETDSLHAKVRQELMESWQSISSPWVKLDIAFGVAAVVSEKDKQYAEEWLGYADDVRREIALESESEFKSILRCIDLTIRAYKGLVIARRDQPADIDKISDLIASIGCPAQSAILWGKIACVHFIADRAEEGRRIVRSKVRPQYDLLDDTNVATKHSVLVEIAPALWHEHHETTLEGIRTLDPYEKDAAVWNIVQFILTKIIPGEPFEAPHRHVYDIEYSEAYDVVILLQEVEDDGQIYWTLKKLINTLVGQKKRARITQDQMNILAVKVGDLVNNNLPSKYYIQHDGYRIAAEVELGRMRGFDKSLKDSFVERALRINNVSDSCLLLIIIAESIPAKHAQERKDLLRQAKGLIGKLFSSYDKLDRYETIAEAAWEVDKKFAQECIKEAMSLTRDKGGNDEAVEEKQKSLVDLAYRISPEFAASLVSLSDNDPARKKAKSSAEKRMDLHNTKKLMLDERERFGEDSFEKNREYPEAAFRILGSLNAGMVHAVHSGRVREALFVGGRYKLSEGFSIYSWAAENVNKMYASTEQSEQYIRPVFDAALSASKIALDVISLSHKKSQRATSFELYEAEAVSMSVSPGQREGAIDFVTRWVATNKPEYLKISEPYFGIEDLELVKIVSDLVPNISLHLLISEKSLRQDGLTKPWDDAFDSAWRRRFSEQEPPDTEIVVASVQPSGASPIHDRWWVGPKGGLRLGTSWNSLGKGKASDISELSEAEAVARERELDKYIIRKDRDVNGNRIKYATFNL